MKNKISFISLLHLIILLVVGCSKQTESFSVIEENGIKIYLNSDVPNDPQAKLEFKKLFTISSEAMTDTTAFMKRAVGLAVDNENNIFVLDDFAMDVKKFDSKGEFITNFGGMGYGPGELSDPRFVFIDNDTVKILNEDPVKISKYNLDGKFISAQLLADFQQLQNVKISRDGSKIASFVVKPSLNENDQLIIDYPLSIIGIADLKEKYSLVKQTFPFQDILDGKKDFNDVRVPFTPGEDAVFLSDNSDRQYRIYVYDYEGNKKSEIRKKFRQIRFSDEEKRAYEDMMKQNISDDWEFKKNMFKKAVSEIFTDKYGRLLVYPGVDRNVDREGVYIDIFKDGKFLNRVSYSEIQDKENMGYFGSFEAKEFYIGERLYVIRSKDRSIDVYDY
jgi:hypothetical protein